MRTLFATAALAAALGFAGPCHGQGIWDPSYPQAWPPGAYQPTNRDLPFSHRYNYYSGPAWYLGMSGRQAYYLEYLDRVDRAERFGRPIPLPPPALSQPPRCRILRAPPVVVPVEEPVELAPPPQPVKKG